MSSSKATIVLVTGSSSGIGYAISYFLASKDCRVYASARRVDRLKELVDAARSDNLDLHPIRLDVTEVESIQQAVQKIRNEAGEIEVLVNNAGISIIGPVEGLSLEECREQFEVNFFGLLAVTKAVLPHMRRNRRGIIVNISSIVGRLPYPYKSLYCASKFAVEGLSEALRYEVRPFGVRIVLIEPGPVKTNFNKTAAERGRRFLEDPTNPYYPYIKNIRNRLETNIEERAGEPSRVAEAVWKAIRSRKPKLRYVVNPPRMGILTIRRLLPDEWFEQLAAKNFKLD